jgi:hypothetical protein
MSAAIIVTIREGTSVVNSVSSLIFKDSAYSSLVLRNVSSRLQYSDTWLREETFTEFWNVSLNLSRSDRLET